MARQGGNDNAMTSYDSTAYFQMIAKDRLELVMAMEADRMVNLDLADEHVYPERDVILEERRSRVDNEPSALLGEQLMAAQYLHHPYRLPVIGWFHEIAGYTREDALDFYRAVVRAQQRGPGGRRRRHRRRAAPAGRARPTAGSPARPVPPRRRLAEPPQHAERRVSLHHERVRQPSLMRSYLAPSYASPGHEHAYALEVLAEILGGGGTSRLFRAVVVEQGPGGRRRLLLPRHRPRWRHLPRLRQPAPRASTWPSSKARSMAEIARVLADGVTEDELARTQRRLLAEVDLRPRFAGRCRARVRLGADLRRGRGRCRGVARADRRGDAGAGPRRRPPRVPARAVGDRPAAAGGDRP